MVVKLTLVHLGAKTNSVKQEDQRPVNKTVALEALISGRIFLRSLRLVGAAAGLFFAELYERLFNYGVVL